MPARRSKRQARTRTTRVTAKRGAVRLVARKRPARPTVAARLRRIVRRVQTRRAVQPRRIMRAAAPQPITTPSPVAVTVQPTYAPPPSPPAPQGRPEDRFVIPAGYGETKLVLLVRDPWWLYAYWEVRGEREAEVRQQIPSGERQTTTSILRMYDVTDDPGGLAWCDIALRDMANNWYIHVGAPNRSWVAELGFLTASGRFFPLVRSNLVRTPRYGPSEVIDEEWMCPDDDYWKLFGVAGGFGIGRSSLEVRERFAQQPLEFWSSGSGRSGAASAGPRPSSVARSPTRRVPTSAFRKPSPPASRASVRSP